MAQDHEAGLIEGFDHYNQQFISLSNTQSHYVETSYLPLVLHGAAGSGKTYMGFSMLQEKLQYDAKTEEAPRCLYITKEKPRGGPTCLDNLAAKLSYSD